MSVRFPDWLPPMAATLTRERFKDDAWVYERKLDGIRVLAFKQGRSVRLFSRNHLPQNDAYPELVRAIEALAVEDVVLDGEATGGWDKHAPNGYHLFDVLWLNGRDLTSVPLEERRAQLERLSPSPPLYLVERVEGPEPWSRACQEGWEGVIAKRRDSAYEHRRSPFWLKMKCEASQELVVGGFTEPQGKRVGLGALLVGYFDDGELVFAGKVGTGFDTKLLLELRARLDALRVDERPFTRGTGLPRAGARWVRPELVVQVAFMEWTGYGKLRHPRLLGLREDKDARDVHRES